MPVQRVGRLTLNRNPDNFFAETEQVAFHVGHVVPGIDFTNDPLLQGRLFSYTDTQLIRLGGPNFHEIPINRPIAPVSNNQRDGHMRQAISAGKVSYGPNTLGDDAPTQAKAAAGGYVSFAQPIEGAKVRQRGASFFDHYSQARMFFRSQSEPEQQHLIKALRFELGKVKNPDVRERMVHHLAQVDGGLARSVAKALGMTVPTKPAAPPNLSVPADGRAKDYQHRQLTDPAFVSAALSMATHAPGPIATRKVAVLVAEGFDAVGVASLSKSLARDGAAAVLVGPHVGPVIGDDGKAYGAPFSILTTSSVLFDAVAVADGVHASDWIQEVDAVEFVKDAYKHCKAIAAVGAGLRLLEAADIPVDGPKGDRPADSATVVGERFTRPLVARFLKAMADHRLWSREADLHLPM